MSWRYLCLVLFLGFESLSAQTDLEKYNVNWETQSKNSAESMPLGGRDIGLNVWVENNDILFYIAQSGSFDENNTLLKQGRIRLRLSPNPLEVNFNQLLRLKTGDILIRGGKKGQETEIKLWVDVFSSAIHVQVNAAQKIESEIFYENWRFEDLFPKGRENNMNSWKWAPPTEIVTKSDRFEVSPSVFYFYHQNTAETAFDTVVEQQQLTAYKDSLFNPLKDRISGGALSLQHLEFKDTGFGKYQNTAFKYWRFSSKAARSHHFQLALYNGQNTLAGWKSTIVKRIQSPVRKSAQSKTLAWWANFWNRSHIKINYEKGEADLGFRIGRNYQLFRYMLACNAYGEYPTKFNGGLFTYDPVSVDSIYTFTPDFRNWGGGTFTAQNQRLVYWPMLRSGDLDMMPSQFDFYNRLLDNVELRTKVYWGHRGASFTEQLENFGLPNPAEYGWKRPADFDAGMEYNAWLEYQWDNALEFCYMIFKYYRYSGQDISRYIPLVESCLTFFDEHYQYLASQRGRKVLDEKGKLVIYPGTAAETYKMAYNPNSTLAGLRRVASELTQLPDILLSAERKEFWKEFLNRLPEISFREMDGATLIAPAIVWERMNNTESPQLYPVFPWDMFGIGRDSLSIAKNTYLLDPDVQKFRSHVGWRQHNIFAARLGLIDEAKDLLSKKLDDSGRRFPAFWGPGFDWVPDHNWGGSGMIGLQEMLMQEVGDEIYVLPTWPKEWNVDFKLHGMDDNILEGAWKENEFIRLEMKNRTKKIIK
ncbi:hypothetical protein FAZ19_01450 [Sphingobacterium alkalisoli]|uniref:DUF5703 domain-containing protein n=1 Tax=Sphingobacterium alkalisoli TaxID=1874115 RepID=A0A4U0H7W4_9SPHI|nr:DUF5703 domain-containing protein [Sphingobacterium alkalisoli]TJY67955.1 hypothetical protein FAZ19_01450 [Sphingobacterium alkalisoli]GGH10117.1 hypothetical protein GCM10011418_08390 [Sphingobacterium alkalisoli]